MFPNLCRGKNKLPVQALGSSTGKKTYCSEKFESIFSNIIIAKARENGVKETAF